MQTGYINPLASTQVIPAVTPAVAPDGLYFARMERVARERGSRGVYAIGQAETTGEWYIVRLFAYGASVFSHMPFQTSHGARRFIYACM